MVAANIKIIEDLKRFLHDVTHYAVNRAFFTQKPTDFSRHRQLPMSTVVGMLMDFFKRSLAVEIQEFFEHLQHQQQAPTASAFCQQRKKLKPAFFQLCNQVLCDSFYTHYGEAVKRWRGFLLVAADGSSLYLPPAQELVEHFGTQENQHVQIPMARAVQLYDVLNGITLWGGLFPLRKAESVVLCENVRFLPCGSIVVLDRYFPGFALMYLLRQRGVHFVIRCKLDFNSEVKAFVRSHKCSKIVALHATPDARSRLKELGQELNSEAVVKVRLVKFTISPKQTEVLLTDLVDEQLYSVEDFKELYGLRWRIETHYSKEKNQLQLEQFSGVSVWCIEQDYHACIFVANLQALVEKQCSAYVQRLSVKRKQACKINTNCSVAALKHWVVKLFLSEETEAVLVYLQQAFQRNVVPVRPGRKYKRKRKDKRHKSKFQTFTNYKRAI